MSKLPFRENQENTTLPNMFPYFSSCASAEEVSRTVVCPIPTHYGHSTGASLDRAGYSTIKGGEVSSEARKGQAEKGPASSP